ncbi:MAG: hypothetical protein J5678_03720 [Bacteroidaceae bacterium]|nr:hypothetical protein [Bacteroidaceae bacterium]
MLSLAPALWYSLSSINNVSARQHPIPSSWSPLHRVGHHPIELVTTPSS